MNYLYMQAFLFLMQHLWQVQHLCAIIVRLTFRSAFFSKKVSIYIRNFERAPPSWECMKSYSHTFRYTYPFLKSDYFKYTKYTASLNFVAKTSLLTFWQRP